MDEAKILDLEKEAKKALQIAIIAEEEHRWIDSIEAYKIVVNKNYKIGDNERARVFEGKIKKIR